MRALGSPSRLDTMPAPLLFVASAISQYAGAAVAVLLFGVVPAAGLAWLRIVAAATVLLAWRRPWRNGLGGRAPGVVIAFGAALAAMNLTYYLAIARLPLGTATAIEFLGPVVVAAVGTRTLRDLGALLLALAGVGLLVEVQLSASPSGVAFALAAAAFWALYIVLGARVAAGGHGIDDLALSMAAGAVLLIPIAGPSALPAFASFGLAAACLGVGVLSSVIPYGLDQRILARMTPGHFALLLCLLPVTATLMGALVLRQIPTPPEAAGIGLVIAAVALRSPR